MLVECYLVHVRDVSAPLVTDHLLIFFKNFDPLNVKGRNKTFVLLSEYFLKLLLILFLNCSAVCKWK